MRRLVLAGLSLLAALVPVTAATAAPITFGYTGALQTFTVRTTGLYDILAYGAQGSDFLPYDFGGRGAEIGGDFDLNAGQTLVIAVAGAGVGDGGGGGSFVVLQGAVPTPLVIAGGGGGSAEFDNGGNGLAGTAGGMGHNISGGMLPPTPGGAGGINGLGGGAGAGTGSGGGGFRGMGAGLDGGGGFPGLAGGSPGFVSGGFGGGGGGGGYGGGGGGYSGGGGGGDGGFTHFGAGGGGGGGSYDGGTNAVLIAGDLSTGHAGNGLVVITPLSSSIPEPTELAVLGIGLAGLTLVRRRPPA